MMVGQVFVSFLGYLIVPPFMFKDDIGVGYMVSGMMLSHFS